MIWLCRVHPPTIHAELEYSFIEMFPINITGFGAVSIIYTYSGGIFHIRRPTVNTGLRPGFDVEEQSLFIQSSVRFGSRTEWGPYGNHHAGIQSMYFVNHIFGTAESRVLEIHGIPEVVMSPVLPVLNDTIQRNPQLAILFHYSYCFFLTFISFFTLHEAITPQRHHWYITGQCTYFGYNSISRTTIHKVIVYAIADFGTEGGFLFVVGICSTWVVVPKHSVAFGGLEERRNVFHIALNQMFGYVTLHHLPILQLSESVKTFFFACCEALINAIGGASSIVNRSKSLDILLFNE